MSKLRWNPVSMEWVIMATERQERPVFPEGHCPFDPGASEDVPTGYEMLAIPNKYPSLQREPPNLFSKADDFFRVAPARGICEIVLYSPNHDTVLEDEPVPHIKKVIDLWQDRYTRLGEEPFVKYVFVFENRGEVIGVTLPHPHGQIYAYSYIPAFIERRLEGSRRFYLEKGRCLFCETIAREKEASPSRIVVEDEHFVSLVPFWAKWSYEVNIYPKRHLRGLDEMREAEKGSLARTLKSVLLKYDGLFGFRLPFIMAMHQRPTDGAEEYDHCHLSIEFYPPHRSRDRLKYLAGSETGAGAHINVTSPEAAAEELRGVKIDA
ncbi:MAG: galactose-1-phosphate uridylyltransferase [Candidatus Bathyarchaeota archaeon]|jgi:UDPglucose--hexose-1-phosphate uridylyltransferase|nr:galactose-1-phosphate uridylyltransferase [Candidatus Bathyarchaeota archaeon]